MKDWTIFIVLMIAAAVYVGYASKDHKERLESPEGPSSVCINGVVYYMVGHSLAPAFDRGSNVKLCNTKGEL